MRPEHDHIRLQTCSLLHDDRAGRADKNAGITGGLVTNPCDVQMLLKPRLGNRVFSAVNNVQLCPGQLGQSGGRSQRGIHCIGEIRRSDDCSNT